MTATRYSSRYSKESQDELCPCKLLKRLVDVMGFEPTTPWLQTRCSPN